MSVSSVSGVTITFPAPLNRAALNRAQSGGSDNYSGFSVDAQGTGSITGLTYTVSAYTKGRITAKLQTPALTSTDMANLNTLINSFLDSSTKNEVKDYEKTHTSANCSVFAFWSNGGSASYDKTHEAMKSSGLSESQITQIITTMLESAQKMSSVEIDFEVDNSANDYAVSGSLLLYTISGKITTNKTETQFRMLADQGIAGSSPDTAHAEGTIIPLS